MDGWMDGWMDGFIDSLITRKGMCSALHGLSLLQSLLVELARLACPQRLARSYNMQNSMSVSQSSANIIVITQDKPAREQLATACHPPEIQPQFPMPHNDEGRHTK